MVIKRVEPTAYDLEQARDTSMHDVFHVNLLKPWNAEKHGVIPRLPTLTLVDNIGRATSIGIPIDSGP